LIREVAGDGITLIDTGAAVARELKRRVDTELPPRVKLGVVGNETFHSSGDVERATRIVSQLWGADVAVEALSLEYC
jgi:glutamate racemase